MFLRAMDEKGRAGETILTKASLALKHETATLSGSKNGSSLLYSV